MAKKLTFIDLFAGCGGLSLGLTNAGLAGVFAIEKAPDAFATFKHNLVDGNNVPKFHWPDWLPQKEMTSSDLLTKYKKQLKKLAGTIDLIAGGPPCQGFSFAGRRNPDDPRNTLTEEYIEIVKIIRPRYLLLENVKGFKAPFISNGGKSRKDTGYSDVVKQKLESIGYEVFPHMVDAADFGVPQSRHRFVMIAYDKKHKFKEDPFVLLEPIISEFKKDKGLPKKGTVSVADAISDIKTDNGKYLEESSESKGFTQIKYKRKSLSNYQKLMKSGCPTGYIPNGLRIARHTPEVIKRFKIIQSECEKGKSVPEDKLKQLGTKKRSFTPLHPDKTSRTITTLPDDLLHYSEPRILTVRENARIQSFPDWFEIKGKYTTGGDRRKNDCPKYSQIGNAVPPLLAEVLGRLIIRVDKEN